MKSTSQTSSTFYGKTLFAFSIFIFLTFFANAQTTAKWLVNGNTVTTGDWLGTINNEDLIFKTNSTTALKIKANGNVIVKSLDSSGNGLVTVDNSGKLIQVPFTGSTSQVLLGDGTFGTTPGLWSTGTGSKIYYNAGKVGIGTATPNYLLDVNGDVRIANNLYLQGALVISDKIQTPKQMKAGSIVVDSLLMDSTRAVYGIATFANDVKLQSKLSVYGNATVNGSLTANSISTPNISTTNFSVSTLLAANKITVNRISGTPGDTVIRIGDSTMYLDWGHNRIYSTPTTTTTGGITTIYGGLALGTNSQALGVQSIAIGSSAKTLGPQSIAIGYATSTGTAFHSICMGAGGTGAFLTNNIANSFMLGFSSDIPTVFVSNSAGTGTTGNVSIGGNTSPTYKFQVESGNTDAFLLKTTSVSGLGMKVEVNSGTNQAIVVENSGTINFKLLGNGRMYAREVNVQLGTFPDYVFSNNYNLLNINELSDYVKKNNHLPNIPSAEEVKKDGIGVGELQLKLLEKVEELTLYVIDQNEKLKKLEQSNLELKKQIEESKK
ncbi:MAG: hypothetical protein ACXVDZ_10575 [Bacteroidia bacterium]